MITRTSLAFLLVLVGFIGCESNSVVAPILKTLPNSNSGEFQYALNGITIDRQQYFIGSYANAALQPMSSRGPGAKELTIDLQLTQTSIFTFRTTWLRFYVLITGADTGSYLISSWNDPTDARVKLTTDTEEYHSQTGGSFRITKFDTSNNSISGTFDFTALLASQNAAPNRVATISSGFFTDVPISIGSYGQGDVTANIDGYAFETTRNHAVVAYIYAGSSKLMIVADDDDPFARRELELDIGFPSKADFTITGTQSYVTSSASYFTSGAATDVSIATGSGTSGKLTITMYDTTRHRLSGTFNFKGPDANSGKNVQVTNGMIDNVEWFVL